MKVHVIMREYTSYTSTRYEKVFDFSIELNCLIIIL